MDTATASKNFRKVGCNHTVIYVYGVQQSIQPTRFSTRFLQGFTAPRNKQLESQPDLDSKNQSEPGSMTGPPAATGPLQHRCTSARDALAKKCHFPGSQMCFSMSAALRGNRPHLNEF